MAKSLTDYTNHFSPINFKKNDSMILNYFLIGLSLAFSLCTGLVKKLLKATRNKKNKHNKTIMLAISKLNSIESKISEALINNQISHEHFMTIINEEKIIEI